MLNRQVLALLVAVTTLSCVEGGATEEPIPRGSSGSDPSADTSSSVSSTMALGSDSVGTEGGTPSETTGATATTEGSETTGSDCGAAAALVVGSDALRVCIDRLEDGGVLTLTSDGTFDLDPSNTGGPVASVLVDAARMPLGEADLADILVQSAPNGVSLSWAPAPIRIAAEDGLPGGHAFVAGASSTEYWAVSQGKLRIEVQDTHSRFFQSHTKYWPQQAIDDWESYGVNITPSAPDVGPHPNQWQIKPMWAFSRYGDGGDGNPDTWGTNDGTDLFFRYWGDAFHGAWDQGTMLTGNDNGPPGTSPHGFQAAWQIPGLVNRSSGFNGGTLWPAPFMEEHLVDLGSADGSSNDGTIDVVISQVALPSTGMGGGLLMASERRGAALSNTQAGAPGGVDTVTLPGYCAGFHDSYGPNGPNAPNNGGLHQRWVDPYNAFGDGAAIRAYLSDDEDWRAARRRTLLQPLYGEVSSTTASFDLRPGWFDLSSLDGVYVVYVGADNQQIASVPLFAGS